MDGHGGAQSGGAGESSEHQPDLISRSALCGHNGMGTPFLSSPKHWSKLSVEPRAGLAFLVRKISHQGACVVHALLQLTRCAFECAGHLLSTWVVVGPGKEERWCRSRRFPLKHLQSGHACQHHFTGVTGLGAANADDRWAIVL